MVRGPWYISARAVRSYCTLTGRDGNRDSDFNAGEDELLRLVRKARFVLLQRNGLERWVVACDRLAPDPERRGRPRLLLLVGDKSEGKLPVLVDVVRG